MILIEYWNSKDIIGMLYQQQFKQKLYLDTKLSHPDYPIEEEGAEDSSGLFVPEFIKWMKQYVFEAIVPEYVVDAMMTLSIHDNVYIDGTRVYDFSVEDISWIGHFAKISASFHTGGVIRSRCCSNFMLAPQNSPVPGGQCYEPTQPPVIDAIWDTDDIFLNPLLNSVSHGDRYLVISEIDVFEAHILGSVYEWVVNEWVEQEYVQGDGVVIDDGSIPMYFDGVWWQAYCYITMVNQSGLDQYHVTGFAIPNTFVYVQYSDDGGITWNNVTEVESADRFNSTGIYVNVPEGDYTWRISASTWSCEYDPINDIYKESGFWLINDSGDYFTQNAAGDKWYR